MTPCAVLHLCRGREWRGGERQVLQLVAAQRRMPALTPTVLTGRGTELARQLELGGALMHQVPWKFALDLRGWPGAGRAVASLQAGHQQLVLHAHDSHALQLGIALSWRHGIPLVATRRSATAPGVLWHCPQRVIAISPAVTAALTAAGLPAARLVEIPSAVDLEALRGCRARTVRSASPLIVTVGALTQEKGHRHLVTAFRAVAAAHPDAHLLLVGEGPERAALEQLRTRLSLAGRVTLVGALPHATETIARGTLLVQPSLREALGTAILEALALGTPVIASGVGGPASLLADDHGVLVPPGDADALAAAILALLGDPARQETLRRRGLSRVGAYDASRVAGAVAEVYRSALIQP